MELRARDLTELLEYDAETGALTWCERPIEMFPTARSGKIWNSRFAGQEAFARFDKDGYLKGTLLGKSWQAHRVIWALCHGQWPEGQIDHINGDKTDNRIENLRLVDHVENSRNARRSKANSSGATGVQRVRGKWLAHITIARRQVNLGTHESFEAALAARKAAENAHGFHANHGRG